MHEFIKINFTQVKYTFKIYWRVAYKNAILFIYIIKKKKKKQNLYKKLFLKFENSQSTSRNVRIKT